jgi:hypothetical protein
MKTSLGPLTYCSNIHPGESWTAHFEQLRLHLPVIRERLAPEQPFGLGLRLSHEASRMLEDDRQLDEFRQWLSAQHAYVFTMNGFPYGGFHDTVVKDQVHAPDWTTPERKAYTIRLAGILARLLPSGMEGSISTSPLSYKYWFETDEATSAAMASATQQVVEVADALHRLFEHTQQCIHLDLEPEPDGLLETTQEFIEWYTQWLLPAAIAHFHTHYGYTAEAAATLVRKHIRLCYDICHVAVAYEDHAHVLDQLRVHQIQIGKVQISSALKANLQLLAPQRKSAMAGFNEPTYLHQVVARKPDGTLAHYADLPDALAQDENSLEWRVHFHVPLFIDSYGLLDSTQEDILAVLRLLAEQKQEHHLEVETYTWGVLPPSMQLPMADSIARELEWVKNQIEALNE